MHTKRNISKKSRQIIFLKVHRNSFKYVCEFVKIENDITVVGYKSIGRNTSKFKRVLDMSEIKKEDILKILQQPRHEMIKMKQIFIIFGTREISVFVVIN